MVACAGGRRQWDGTRPPPFLLLLALPLQHLVQKGVQVPHCVRAIRLPPAAASPRAAPAELGPLAPPDVDRRGQAGSATQDAVPTVFPCRPRAPARRAASRLTPDPGCPWVTQTEHTVVLVKAPPHTLRHPAASPRRARHPAARSDNSGPAPPDHATQKVQVPPGKPGQPRRQTQPVSASPFEQLTKEARIALSPTGSMTWETSGLLGRRRVNFFPRQAPAAQVCRAPQPQLWLPAFLRRRVATTMATTAPTTTRTPRPMPP